MAWPLPPHTLPQSRLNLVVMSLNADGWATPSAYAAAISPQSCRHVFEYRWLGHSLRIRCRNLVVMSSNIDGRATSSPYAAAISPQSCRHVLNTDGRATFSEYAAAI